MVAQPTEHLRAQLERIDLNGAVWIERVRADPPVSSHVGVLLADRLAEHVDLDLACGLCQPTRRDRRAPREGEALEQTDRVGARGAHAGACRHVRHRGALQWVSPPVARERLAQDRMAYLGDLIDLLEL